ncbi:MAG: type II toxin-antitoxin system Phd/YefM family antitoxin [Streptosporangiaceae bacterium]|jgi:prevent-host-death family protein
MERIGLRELAHHTAKVVARVREGVTIQVTDHGRPILRLVPEAAAAGDLRAQLIASGALTPASRTGSIPLPEPLSPEEDDAGPTLTETLRQLRDEERY